MKIKLLSTVLSLLFVSNIVYGIQVSGPIVDSEWLANNLAQVTVLDIRKKDDKFSSTGTCGGKIGHINGALFLKWGKVRGTRKVAGQDVKKLIPPKGYFEDLLRGFGVNNDGAIVLTSDGTSSKYSTFATRMYWQLKYYGHDNVAILDGGNAQWVADGKALNCEKTSAPQKGNFSVGEVREKLLATPQEVAQAVKSGGITLIDGRTQDYYLGTKQKSYVYAKGHISGAKNYPHPQWFAAKGPATFLSAHQMAMTMKEIGIDAHAPAITYCDSGHLSTGVWFVMYELLGNKDASLFDGSMHQWTLDKNNPTTAGIME
ncbi:MAG: sulfurtransferase [SAR324 cluster bacterium]|nr:sulfurtransferase [SAR324 cluster bacterium]MBL7035606.1 sulfurtransferase [SAR324 cluster bacterium]